MDARPVRHRLHQPKIDVWSAGEGPTVVLLHGWGLSGRPYREAMGAIARAGHRVVAPSLAVVEGGWTMQRLVERAAETLYVMNAVEAAVVGHSFGGALGVRLALQHPDLVRSLVLVDSFVVSPGARSLARIALPGAHWRVGMARGTALALAHSAVREGGLRGLARQARWVLRTSMDGDLEELRSRAVPTAVLWASDDLVLPRSLGERTAAALGAPLEVVTSQSEGWPLPRPPDHDWPMRAPGFFAGRVTAAVRSLAGAGR